MSYIIGGGSAHLDAAFELYDADESNAGHAPNAEKVVRFADYVEGAVSGLDLTTAYSLSGFAGILAAVSEVFDASEDTAVTDAATVDDETPPNTLTALYAFDIAYADAEGDVENPNPLEQSVGGGVANCSIRCETWSIVAGIKYAIVTDKIVDGRAHGRASPRDAVGLSNLWRRPPTAGEAWVLVGSLDSDGFGHWTSPTLDEAYSYDPLTRYLYTVAKTQPADGSAANIGEVYTREYVVETIVLTVAGVHAFWQVPRSFMYVFYGDSGIKHVYSSPPHKWFATHTSHLANYPQPKTDSVDDDSSPSGYVDGNGKIRLFFVRSGALYRATSQNWGGTWDETVPTVVTDADQAFAFRSLDGSRQNLLYITDGTLHHAYSHNHFTTVDGSVLIATGADDAQPCGYEGWNGELRAFVLADGTVYRWDSFANGVWASVATPLTGCDSISVIVSVDGSRQHAFYVKEGALQHASSHKHLSTVDETILIDASVDSGQVCGYDFGQSLYCFGFSAGQLTCWQSTTRGRTWVEVGVV